MILAHGPISYIANELIQKKSIKGLKSHEQVIISIASLFFGILPDFDLFLTHIINLPSFIHHEILTHFPIFYIVLWIILRLLIRPVSKVLNKKSSSVFNPYFLKILVNAFLIGTLSHLFADTITSDIVLLYPFSLHKFVIFKYLLKANLFTGYYVSALFSIEIVFISIFFLLFYKKFLRLNKVVTIFFKSLIGISFVGLLFSIYVSLNTYNNSYMYDSNGKINYDIDYDNLQDSNDMDIWNDCRDNIQKVDNIELSDSALNIVNSKKWASSSKAKYFWGGFDSYRMISQAYYDIHYPLEPVLESYYFKENSYTYYIPEDVSYEKLLFEYLKGNGQLLELNMDSSVNITLGKIFILKDIEENILNLGITLEANHMAIVLENDEVLQMHSYESVREYYKDSLAKVYIQN